MSGFDEKGDFFELLIVSLKTAVGDISISQLIKGMYTGAFQHFRKSIFVGNGPAKIYVKICLKTRFILRSIGSPVFKKSSTEFTGGS